MGPQSEHIEFSMLHLVFIASTTRNSGKNFCNLLFMHIMWLPFPVLPTFLPSFSLWYDAPSPETISLQLPPTPLPPDHYAKHILLRLTDGHKRFTQVRDIDQAEKGGNGPPEGKFMKLGGKVNFRVLSSKIDVIRAKKEAISLVLTNKTSFSC